LRVEAIYIAPVKSLALQRMERVSVGVDGIFEDRRFFVIDEGGRVFTQREHGALAQVQAAYDRGADTLRLTFPDGSVVEGTAAAGDDDAPGNFYGHTLAGRAMGGAWSEALSRFAGQPLRLVLATELAHDVLPVSMCSEASVGEVRRRAGGVAVDERRFRPNFLLSGVGPHGEDAFVGKRVRLGAAAIVRVQMLDSRCAMTTHDPVTGEVDLDTLKLIASYRTDQPNQVNFGVYGTVEREADVAAGDEVRVLEEEA
jgi:uncharacterized protein YcbX